MSGSRRATTAHYAVACLYLVFIIGPVVWLFSVAFKSPAEVLTTDPTWLPHEPTLSNFRSVFVEQPVLRSALNSLVISGSTAALCVVLALPCAFLSTRRPRFGRTVMLWAILSQAFPLVLTMIPVFLAAIALGLYDSRTGLVLVNTVWNLPFALWLLRDAVAALPRFVEDQATVDGASEIQTLRHVTAPLVGPAVVTTALFAFINTWNEFFFALILIADETKAPLSLMVVRFIGVDSAVRLGPLAAASMLCAIPSVVLFLVIQSRLTSDVWRSAVAV